MIGTAGDSVYIRQTAPSPLPTKAFITSRACEAVVKPTRPGTNEGHEDRKEHEASDGATQRYRPTDSGKVDVCDIRTEPCCHFGKQRYEASADCVGNGRHRGPVTVSARMLVDMIELSFQKGTRRAAAAR